MNFKNKVIVITGTRKGIGEYLAKMFLSRGAFVEGCSRSNNEFVHDNYIHLSLDITDADALEKWFFDIGKRHKRIDVLINNAGAASMNHMALTPHNTVRYVLNLNVAATFDCCRNAVRYLKKSDNGKIINFSSIAVPLRTEGEAIYSASKIAVEQLTRIFAKELSSMGISCNCIGPSPIDTDLIKNVPHEKIEKLIQMLPSKKKGTLEEIWELVSFFASDRSNFVTGQIIYMGGLN